MKTDNRVLVGFLRGAASRVEGGSGAWTVTFDGHKVQVLTEETHDRMRLMTPVADASTLSREDLHVLLEADFDRALDARYAIRDGQVWSAFIHPLSPLTEGELVSGLRQVVGLARTYGTTYTSGELVFRQSRN